MIIFFVPLLLLPVLCSGPTEVNGEGMRVARVSLLQCVSDQIDHGVSIALNLSILPQNKLCSQSYPGRVNPHRAASRQNIGNTRAVVTMAKMV